MSRNKAPRTSRRSMPRYDVQFRGPLAGRFGGFEKMRVRRCLVLFLGAVLSSAALPLVPFYPIPPAGATAGGPIRISANASGVQGNAGGGRPVLSGDGRLAAFGSLSTNLVPGDTNTASDFFVRDVPSGAISRASVAHLTGVQLNGK